MIETITHTEVKKYYEKKKDDVWFKKFMQFQEAMDLVFLLKTMDEELKKSKEDTRIWRDKFNKLNETPEEPVEEEETPEDIIQDDIFGLPELSITLDPNKKTDTKDDVAVEMRDETRFQKEPKQAISYPCPDCDKTFPNKGLLEAHRKLKHSGDND